ncbi:hypothetical protein OGAPHI_001360 [Ogataea philodendri]|uniref:Uncharacterized protein n=1 Tax=Ogataea philodendri TaxID=1378263 RepID=A0A9P8PDF3_9ASCO|nr:uncharacterized protein OGAPHI_001360 [Ogataea philodendri]KAH3669239.1 hypothetical protein OGAPHI_001360 [Ogataea philodendri]
MELVYRSSSVSAFFLSGTYDFKTFRSSDPDAPFWNNDELKMLVYTGPYLMLGVMFLNVSGPLSVFCFDGQKAFGTIDDWEQLDLGGVFSGFVSARLAVFE